MMPQAKDLKRPPEERIIRTSLAVMLPMQGVRSLVRELRSHIASNVARKLKKKTKDCIILINN